MPLLDAVAPLPASPRRILVAGTSGAGKTTVARRVAALLDLSHIEIDALFHGQGWTPRDTFESEVHGFSASSGWVTEWQYSQVRTILAQRGWPACLLRNTVATTLLSPSSTPRLSTAASAALLSNSAHARLFPT